MTEPAGNQLPADHRARRRAAEELRRNFFVEAAAGTGKTTALIGRVVNLITAGGVTVERIAAITFTENAARELREKIRGALRRRLPAAAPDEAQLLRAALEGLPLAPFNTIHGFCASLLREFAVAAGVDPDFEVADAGDANTVELEQFWRDWLALQPPERAPLLTRLELAEISADDIKELAFELLDKRAWLESTRPQPAAALEPCLVRIDALTAQLAELTGRACVNPRDALCKALALFTEKIRATRAIAPEERQLALKNVAWTSAAKVNEKNWTAIQDGEQARRLAEEIAGLLGGLYHEQVLELVEWLKGFIDYYRERRRAQGQLDFDELLIRARDLLRGNREARRALQRRFDALLVDEFQDTDPLQIEIVWFLCESEPLADDWRAARLQTGKLFVVGDPKQSIFRFRKADIESYQRARDCFPPEDQLFLTVNFRATPAPVHWINGLFGQLIRRPADGDYQPDYVPLIAHRGREAHGKTIYLRAAPDGDAAAAKPTIDDYRRREAELVARWIARQLREPTLQIRDAASGALRPPRPGDFAILFRGLKQVQYYEDALRAADVDYHLLGGQTFYRSPAVLTLLHLARAADQPGVSLHFVSALRSPVFACADDAIFLCHERHGLRPDRLAEVEVSADDAALAPVLDAAKMILRWNAAAAALPVSALLEKIIDDAGLLVIYGARRNAARQLANLRKAVELARRLEAAGSRTLGAVCEFLRQCRDFEALEEEPPAAEESAAAARLLTIHKAKGLEYPIVILAELFAGVRSPALAPALFSLADGNVEFNLGKNVMSAGFPRRLEREKILADAEALRLLYVATTRAAEHLVVPWVVAESELSQAEKHGRLLQFITQADYAPVWGADGDPAPDANGAAELVRGEIVLNSETAPRVETEQLRVSGAAPGREAWFHFPLLDAAPPDDPRVAALLDKRRAWFERRERLRGAEANSRNVLTPSAEARHVDADDAPRAAQRGPDAAQTAADSDAAGGAAFGTVVHNVLERLNLPDCANLQALLEKFARRESLNEAELRQARELLDQLIVCPDFQRIRHAKNVFREVPFCVECDGGLIEGVIDCLFEEDGRLWIVDWKTDRVPPGGIGELRERYSGQCRAYRRAVERGLRQPPAGVGLFILRAAPPRLVAVE